MSDRLRSSNRGSDTPDSAQDAARYPSVSYQKTVNQLRRFARDRSAPILIEGESGTGKTRAARLVHAWSARARAPYHAVVLSTLDDTLASSELFGHVAGAFTDARSSRTGHFATANGGTLFLDEIGKASLAVQQKLLHAVEYNEIRPVGSDRDVRIDVRLVAATNISLEHLVHDGRFLADLEARLGSFRVRMPALRERGADIPTLVAEYVASYAAQCGYDDPPDVDDALVTALRNADWPNNLRQLSATVHRILVDAEGAAVLRLEHCLDDLAYLRESPARLTDAAIDQAIDQAGSIAGAARLLGVDRTTIYRFRRRGSNPVLHVAPVSDTVRGAPQSFRDL